MKSKSLFLLFSILMMTGGCGKMVTEDYLIGGKWIAISGYEDREIGGDPVCPPFEEGIEFIDEETVYVKYEDKEFGYHLRESKDGMEIEFYNPISGIGFYKIYIEDNGFGLIGSGMVKIENCYFERKE